MSTQLNSLYDFCLKNTQLYIHTRYDNIQNQRNGLRHAVFGRKSFQIFPLAIKNEKLVCFFDL